MVLPSSHTINPQTHKVSAARYRCPTVTSETVEVEQVTPLQEETVEVRLQERLRTEVRSLALAMRPVRMEDLFPMQVEISFPLVEWVEAVSSSTQMSSKSTELSMHPAKMVNKAIDISTDQEMEDQAQALAPVEASSCLPMKSPSVLQVEDPFLQKVATVAMVQTVIVYLEIPALDFITAVKAVAVALAVTSIFAPTVHQIS